VRVYRVRDTVAKTPSAQIRHHRTAGFEPSRSLSFAFGLALPAPIRSLPVACPAVSVG
jgi:hypothetical protein